MIWLCGNLCIHKIHWNFGRYFCSCSVPLPFGAVLYDYFSGILCDVAPLRILRRAKREKTSSSPDWFEFLFLFICWFFCSFGRSYRSFLWECVVCLSFFSFLYYLSFEYSFISLYSNSKFFLLSQIVRLCVVLERVCASLSAFFVEKNWTLTKRFCCFSLLISTLDSDLSAEIATTPTASIERKSGERKSTQKMIGCRRRCGCRCCCRWLLPH